MRCQSCNYTLWNLTARKCPECGAPFKPSDFEFTINSVQFCCPHCRQPYYGTGDRGHLVPPNFDCVSCAKRIDMDEMVLLPTEGVQEEQTRVDTMPWLERKSGSFFKSWWKTVVGGMSAPTRLIRATPIESSGASAVWFAVTVNTVGMIVGVGSLMMLGVLFAGLRGAGTALLGALGALLVGLLAGIAVSTVILVIWAAGTHGLLCLGGPRAASFGRTLQCLAYSAGPMILGAIPCLGAYVSFVGWVWWLVSATLMLKEGQKISGGRAAFAVLTPPLVLTAVVIGAYAVLLTFVFGAGTLTATGPFPPATTAQATVPPSQQQAEVKVVLDALKRYSSEGNGQGPPHAAELIRINFLAPMLLKSSWSAPEPLSAPARALIGNFTIEDFSALDEKTQRAALADAVAALPPADQPYRLGDYVFTDRGIDTKVEHLPPLWLLICYPDPEVNPVAPRLVLVGLSDGSVQMFPALRFSAALAEQNLLRSTQGLPAIPDPATILHPRAAAPQAPDTLDQGSPPAPDPEPEK